MSDIHLILFGVFQKRCVIIDAFKFSNELKTSDFAARWHNQKQKVFAAFEIRRYFSPQPLYTVINVQSSIGGVSKSMILTDGVYNNSMKTTIDVICPTCGGNHIVRNGKKSYKPQNYLCKDCGRQFIAEHDRTYNGTTAGIEDIIKRALVRGCGIRDIAVILLVSIGKVLSILANSRYELKPKKTHYTRLEKSEELGIVRQNIRAGLPRHRQETHCWNRR